MSRFDLHNKYPAACLHAVGLDASSHWDTAAKLIHNCWGKNQQSALGQFSIGRVGQFSISADRQGPGHTIAVAKHLIEKSGLGAIKTADQLPPPEEMDDFIHQRIQAVIDASQGVYYTKRAKGEPNARKALVCTYGRAQKLVNMYLKLKIVCAGYHDHPHVKAMHPPLDAVLLKALDSSDSIDQESDLPVFLRKLKTAKDMSKTWTTFDRTTYDAYISAIRTFQGNQPLWAIERLWNPEREALPV